MTSGDVDRQRTPKVHATEKRPRPEHRLPATPNRGALGLFPRVAQ